MWHVHPTEWPMVAILSIFFHTKNLRTKEILQYPIVHIDGLEVHPFILEDVAYSICPNLTKNYKTLDPTTWIITYSMQQ